MIIFKVMKKVYYLKTCSTCTRILKSLNLEEWELREIKQNPLTAVELKEMYQLSNSYEALFNKRSMQIKMQNIDVKSLTESNFKTLILSHYSFLKRPVFITDTEIFIGNSKSVVDELQKLFSR